MNNKRRPLNFEKIICGQNCHNCCNKSGTTSQLIRKLTNKILLHTYDTVYVYNVRITIKRIPK